MVSLELLTKVILMKFFIFLLSFFSGLSLVAQEVKIGNVENKIVIGNLAGNRNFAFGVKNVLEEVVQDAGYDLNPDSSTVINVELLFFDVKKTSVQIGVYGKKTDTYMLAAQAYICNYQEHWFTIRNSFNKYILNKIVKSIPFVILGF